MIDPTKIHLIINIGYNILDHTSDHYKLTELQLDSKNASLNPMVRLYAANGLCC
ncbi:hypothetical protein Slin_4311 [Spirosoma linguale DSM 74]|uniref:Uncharacterized protein n=1 Tax=Spirosoma linguale (strain ATCC 33905 / DSM 74 / LMG 10896 / Claus 1) TaxID=504472 RepID=D2QLK3_SPILD|nr:hypothetical protein Slin_4311 [Spirosoma linguale DSM 74]